MSVRWSEDQLRDYRQRSASLPVPVVSRMPVIASARRPGRMNKTEAAYAEHLELQLRGGVIRWWAFERIKFRLADATFYTPDFDVIDGQGAIEFHEVKGFWRDDARVKIKVAAEQNPFRFLAVSKLRQRAGGGWSTEIFGQ